MADEERELFPVFTSGSQKPFVIRKGDMGIETQEQADQFVADNMENLGFPRPAGPTTEELLSQQIPGEPEVDLSQGVPGFALRDDIARSKGDTKAERAKIEHFIPGSRTITVQDPISLKPMTLVTLPGGGGTYIPVDGRELGFGQDLMGDLGDITGSFFNQTNILEGAGVVGGLALDKRLPGARTAVPAALSRFPTLGRAAATFNPAGATARRTALASGGAGAGAATGSLMDDALERARGYNDDPIERSVEEALEMGAVAISFEGGLRLLGGMGGVFSPVIKRLFQGGATDEALRASQELGVPLVFSDLHPLTRSSAAQTIKSGSRAQAHQIDRVQKFYDGMARLRDEMGNINDIPTEQLEAIMDQQAEALLRTLDLPLGKFSPGPQAQRGVQMFDVVRRNQIDDAYEGTREVAQGVTFDFGEARRLVTQSIELSQPTAAGVMPPGLIPINRRHPWTRDFLNDLATMDPRATNTVTGDALSKLQRLRARAVNLKADPQINPDDKILLGKIVKSLTESMDNPRGGSAEFRRRLKIARNRTHLHESTMDKSYARTILLTDTPAKDVGKLLLDPGNLEAVRYTRTMLLRSGQRTKWEAVRNGFKEKLHSLGTGIDNYMNDPFNKRGISVILTGEEQAVFRRYAKELAKGKDTLIARHLRKQRGLGINALELLRQGQSGSMGLTSARELRDLVASLGGKDGPQGRALQAGIVQHLLNESSDYVGGRVVINPQRFVNAMEGLRKLDLIDVVFTERNVKKLGDAKALANLLPIETGAGESLQVATVAAGMTQIVTRPVKFINAVRTIFSNYMVSRFYLSDFASRLAHLPTGVQLGKSDVSYFRMLAAMTALAVSDARTDAQAMFPGEVGQAVSDVDQLDLDPDRTGRKVELSPEEQIRVIESLQR